MSQRQRLLLPDMQYHMQERSADWKKHVWHMASQEKWWKGDRVLGVLDHAAAVGGDAGGDLQAGHAPHGGSSEAVHTVGTDLHRPCMLFILLSV